MFHAHDAAPGLLRAFRAFTPLAPDACTAMLVFTTAPPLPFLPPGVHGKRVIALAWCWSGDPVQGTRIMEPLTHHRAPLGQHAGVVPYARWQQAFDPTAPAGDHYYWKTSQFDNLDDALVDKLVERAAAPPDPTCEVHVHHLGGAVARIADDATAFSQRRAPFFINLIGRTGDGERLPAVRDWVRGLHAILAPHARAGVQPNFTGEPADLEMHAHDIDAREKLVSVRARYDPEGLLAPVRSG
jgi:hypothetical protein